MPTLPNHLNINSLAAGSQWTCGYQLQNDNGTILDITGATFEFVIRPTASDITGTHIVIDGGRSGTGGAPPADPRPA